MAFITKAPQSKGLPQSTGADAPCRLETQTVRGSPALTEIPREIRLPRKQMMTPLKSKPPKDHSAADTVFNAGYVSGLDDFDKFGELVARYGA